MLFIRDLHAAGETVAPAGGILGGLLPFVLIFVVMYFLMIRPQQKKAKAHKALLAGLKAGDEVITIGGLAAKVAKVEDQHVVLSLPQSGGSDVEMRFQKASVQVVLPKGTL